MEIDVVFFSLSKLGVHKRRDNRLVKPAQQVFRRSRGVSHRLGGKLQRFVRASRLDEGRNDVHPVSELVSLRAQRVRERSNGHQLTGKFAQFSVVTNRDHPRVNVQLFLHVLSCRLLIDQEHPV